MSSQVPVEFWKEEAGNSSLRMELIWATGSFCSAPWWSPPPWSALQRLSARQIPAATRKPQVLSGTADKLAATSGEVGGVHPGMDGTGLLLLVVAWKVSALETALRIRRRSMWPWRRRAFALVHLPKYGCSLEVRKPTAAKSAGAEARSALWRQIQLSTWGLYSA